MIAFKNDPEGQKVRLNDIVGRLQDYVLLVNREIFPNISELESKTSISKGDVPKLNPNTVSKAQQIGDVDESEVNEFIQDLKLQ